MAKTYTQEEKEALISAFNDSKRSMNAFLSLLKIQQKDAPAYPTFKKWVDEAKATKPSLKANSSLYAEFQQSLVPEDPRDQYIAFLEAKVAELQAKLAEKA